MRGSKKQAFGDNIYHRDKKTGRWQQADSHHSYADGTPNRRNIANDTQTDRMLISDDFIYWGGSGPAIPKRFRTFDGLDICGKRNYKNSFPIKMVERIYCVVTLTGRPRILRRSVRLGEDPIDVIPVSARTV